MAIVEFEGGTPRIDAAVTGQGLNVEPSLVQVWMRESRPLLFVLRGSDCDDSDLFGALK